MTRDTDLRLLKNILFFLLSFEIWLKTSLIIYIAVPIQDLPIFPLTTSSRYKGRVDSGRNFQTFVSLSIRGEQAVDRQFVGIWLSK